MQIYHNPRCRKSRETLELLVSKGHDPEVILYLDTPLRKGILKKILKQLDMPAKDLIRKNEAIYKENFKGKELSESQWIDAMIKFPKLMERPIVVNRDTAALGRPPENVLAIL